MARPDPSLQKVQRTPNLVEPLVILARFNIPTDVQELLVGGNASRGVPPGALNAALAAAEQRGREEAGRDGWVLAPEEPTQAMLDAGIRARATGWGSERMKNAYAAMLSAIRRGEP